MAKKNQSAGKKQGAGPASTDSQGDSKPTGKKQIEAYTHGDKRRANNPPAGLVTPQSDPPDPPKKGYQYDPHLDPQLVWAGKAEHTSFKVPTVSLHVHERIDPKTIIAAVRTNGERPKPGSSKPRQRSLFEEPNENPPLRDALDFYKHPHGWTNRLVAGDSLLVMNSLLEKEGMAGKVQMIYVDPPYGIRYGSNFQPFTNRRDVKDGKDEDLTQEPETLKAFRDTWERGIHGYLTHLRDRLLLSRALLDDSGSLFVQISNENVHHVREVMDEVFGEDNFVSLIVARKTAAVSSPLAKLNVLATTCDYVLWYAKSITNVKYRQLYLTKFAGNIGSGTYCWVESADGRSRRRMTRDEMRDPETVPTGHSIYKMDNLTSPGWSEKLSAIVEYEGRKFPLPPNLHWKTTPEGVAKLISAGRVLPSGKALMYVRKFDDFPVSPLTDVWLDTGSGSFTDPKMYVVQTNTKIAIRCMLMAQ